MCHGKVVFDLNYPNNYHIPDFLCLYALFNPSHMDVCQRGQRGSQETSQSTVHSVKMSSQPYYSYYPPGNCSSHRKQPNTTSRLSVHFSVAIETDKKSLGRGSKSSAQRAWSHGHQWIPHEGTVWGDTEIYVGI